MMADGSILFAGRKAANHILKTMKNPPQLINKYYFQAALALPLLGILAFSGCSSVGGTAGSQESTTNRAAIYLQQGQETSHLSDSDSDAQYEWFY
jgi:hypothetical protein